MDHVWMAFDAGSDEEEGLKMLGICTDEAKAVSMCRNDTSFVCRLPTNQLLEPDWDEADVLYYPRLGETAENNYVSAQRKNGHGVH